MTKEQRDKLEQEKVEKEQAKRELFQKQEAQRAEKRRILSVTEKESKGIWHMRCGLWDMTRSSGDRASRRRSVLPLGFTDNQWVPADLLYKSGYSCCRVRLRSFERSAKIWLFSGIKPDSTGQLSLEVVIADIRGRFFLFGDIECRKR
jgi:hypothetical protein